MTNEVEPVLGESLRGVLEILRNQKVAVLGDLILDRYIWGVVDRISPEAPVMVVEEMAKEDKLGGAANVWSNLIGLGVDAVLCGVVGDDEAADSMLRLVERAGGTSDQALIKAQGRTTTVKTRVICETQQLVRIDREVRAPISEEARESLLNELAERVEGCGCVVLSDYGKGVVGHSLLAELKVLLERHGHIPLFIDPHPTNYEHYSSASIVKPNAKEASIASGVSIRNTSSAFRAARILRKKWKSQSIMITLGADGLIVLQEDDTRLVLAAEARQVYDVSGAGDCVTAVVSACLAAGFTTSLAGALANKAAGVVISEIGTVPITYDKLLRVL